MRLRLNPDPRDWIIALLPMRPVCAEVGVWRGNFSERMLRLARPTLYYLIDPWRYIPECGSKLYGEGAQTEMDAIYESVLRRFAKDPVVILRMTSIEAAREIPNETLDFAYIDGDHRYERCLTDLGVYWRKIKPGGLMVADDYGLDDCWWGDGVTRAVHEFSVEVGVSLSEQCDHQAAFRK